MLDARRPGGLVAGNLELKLEGFPHSMITGVPTTTFSKNFSDIWCGMRMQPWEAA